MRPQPAPSRLLAAVAAPVACGEVEGREGVVTVL